jgi:thymidylate synthase (FAD)
MEDSMILTKPSHEILFITPDPLTFIERIGRTCYKSEDKIDNEKESAKWFVHNLLARKHLSVIEHATMTVRIICDRGVTHELVRHRLASFSQESTRYCNYHGGVTFIIPPWTDIDPGEYLVDCFITDPKSTQQWKESMKRAEDNYIRLLDQGQSPQQARSVLPNSLKTEIVVTANFREWGHIFSLRCSPKAHPQMQEVMNPLLQEVRGIVPIFFDDLEIYQ